MRKGKKESEQMSQWSHKEELWTIFVIKKVETSKQELSENLEGSRIGNENLGDLNVEDEILNERENTPDLINVENVRVMSSF